MPDKDELARVIRAAQALGLDAPITLYRLVGDRIELWTCHGGPFIYPPLQGGSEGGALSTRGAARRKAKRGKEAGA